MPARARRMVGSPEGESNCITNSSPWTAAVVLTTTARSSCHPSTSPSMVTSMRASAGARKENVVDVADRSCFPGREQLRCREQRTAIARQVPGNATVLSHSTNRRRQSAEGLSGPTQTVIGSWLQYAAPSVRPRRADRRPTHRRRRRRRRAPPWRRHPRRRRCASRRDARRS